MFRVKVEGFVGDEVRLSWMSLPPPSSEPIGISTYETDELSTAVEKSPPPPPLVNSFDSETPRRMAVSGFGGLPSPTVFGLNARRQVSRLASALDLLASGPSNTIFFTGTLPGSTPAALRAISEWSGYIVHRFKAWLNSISNEYSSIYVWEWQKRGALHFHLALYHSDIDIRNRMFDGMRPEWIKLLITIAEKSGVDVFARGGGLGTWRDKLEVVRARAEWVTKSIASYLGKYMSKAVHPGGERSRLFFPSRWWGATQNLKSLEIRHRWSDEHFYSLRGQANGAYNELAGLIGNLADWSAEYEHKVMPGSTMILKGAAISTIKRLLGETGIMSKLNQAESYSQVRAEVIALLSLLDSEHPKYAASFRKNNECVERLHQNWSGEQIRPFTSANDEMCCLLACLGFLHMAAVGQERYGGYCLSPRWTSSIQATSNRFLRFFTQIMDREEMHVLEDVWFPGKVM